MDKDFEKIVELITQSKNKTYSIINKALVELYWKVGEFIYLKTQNTEWGKGTVKELANYISEKEPKLRGFTASNLWRMKQFYEEYSQNEKLAPLVREISWTNNLLILSKTKTVEEKEFYLKKCLQERYSKRELARQIDSAYFERTMLSNTQSSITAEELYPRIKEVFLDNYVVEFLNLKDDFSEYDLQKSILKHLKKFVLEFGKDFLLIDEEYKIQVGNQDFYIDLLFFHRELRCLVAIELKITDFKPEYLGKMNFYLEALDREVKKDHENPSVGIILCKTKDSEVVEYALSRNLSPTLVSEYETKLLDKKILQQKLHELFENE
ncbi:PDDEXK nuclease domain-containing protein [Bernardetia sp.]|uniref:PDDEXK nuclease domain-containing protein n=1 Tax=Bernardetia sp. TaxID=1937974 RepID=UPI0025C067C3|nr:PDDEXK nuclease domain-containing protein [Bernardetia sp.]